MTIGFSGNNLTSSGISNHANGEFIVGADVIATLIPVKYPLIMVDRITNYHSEPLSLIAERYISSNEPAFTGHFPDMKLWPGIYTIEGLRQSCYLLHTLYELEKAGLLKGVAELQKRHTFRPQIDRKLCQSLIDHLKKSLKTDPDLFSISIKLLEPVFAGSLMRFYCSGDVHNLRTWSVQAVVDDRIVAKGSITGWTKRFG